MAPTEILARQHYASFKHEFDKVKIPCCLLVGAMKKKERLNILKGLEEGNISVVIGTHALIQEDIKFDKLGLVVIDEQHRFGVNQRLKLQKKRSKSSSIVYDCNTHTTNSFNHLPWRHGFINH